MVVAIDNLILLNKKYPNNRAFRVNNILDAASEFNLDNRLIFSAVSLSNCRSDSLISNIVNDYSNWRGGKLLKPFSLYESNVDVFHFPFRIKDFTATENHHKAIAVNCYLEYTSE